MVPKDMSFEFERVRVVFRSLINDSCIDDINIDFKLNRV